MWVPLAGLVAQAAITWWKVGAQERALTDQRKDIDSLREWRARARVEIEQLERQLDREDRRRVHDEGREGEEQP